MICNMPGTNSALSAAALHKNPAKSIFIQKGQHSFSCGQQQPQIHTISSLVSIKAGIKLDVTAHKHMIITAPCQQSVTLSKIYDALSICQVM